MHNDPIKPTFKAPGTKLLKLTYNDRVSDFAFNFNLRRYNVESPSAPSRGAAGATAAGFVRLAGPSVAPGFRRSPRYLTYAKLSWNGNNSVRPGEMCGYTDTI